MGSTNPPTPLEPEDLFSLSSSFHQNLLMTLTAVGDQLQNIVASSETLSNSSDTQELPQTGLSEIQDNYHLCLGGVRTFIACLETHAMALDKTFEELHEGKNVLQDERDVLIDRGHELNCRLSYNALERKLDESFTDLERFTSEESAKCFRDEAEENVKRTNDLIRLANMRSCQMDRDTFHQMEKITNVFENYESERGPFVQELDLFSDIRRLRITSWLSDVLSDDDRERGESVIDYINMEQRQRHMESQVIKNALRMYSFNASLNFDRQDNLKRLEDLVSTQAKVNQLSGVHRVLPRRAVAKTNLFSTDKDNFSEGARGDGLVDEMREEEITGKGLHRCPRKINLAANPITDPDTVARLEAALRWEENDGVLTWLDQGEGGAEHVDRSAQQSEQILSGRQRSDRTERTEQTPTVTEATSATDPTLGSATEPSPALGSSSSTTHGIMGGDSVCGDALGCRTDQMDTEDKAKAGKPLSVSGGVDYQLNSRSTHSCLSHIESQPVIPGSAEKHIAGLVRRKHSSRQVGSLTNLQDSEGTSGVHHRQSKVGEESGEERDTRSQGSEPAASGRPTVGGNRSREYVPGGWDKE